MLLLQNYTMEQNQLFCTLVLFILSTFSHYSICKRTDDTRTQNLYRQVSCELKLSPIYYLIDIDALKLI